MKPRENIQKDLRSDQREIKKIGKKMKRAVAMTEWFKCLALVNVSGLFTVKPSSVGLERAIKPRGNWSKDFLSDGSRSSRDSFHQRHC